MFYVVYVSSKKRFENFEFEGYDYTFVNSRYDFGIVQKGNVKVTDVFEDKQLTIHCIHPIEIYAAKLCALLSRTTARDLFDVYTLSKYQLFDKEEKQIKREEREKDLEMER